MNEWITIADTNGDGTLDIHEIEALFVNEVNNPSHTHTHTEFLLLVKMKLPNCLYYVLNITNSLIIRLGNTMEMTSMTEGKLMKTWRE